jgi:fatty-acyl-CoA synthase
VAEAAAIGVADARWGERPLLVVVAREGRTLDPASVGAPQGSPVARGWNADEVHVVTELPHTATGKLDKVRLRALFRAGPGSIAGSSAPTTQRA